MGLEGIASKRLTAPYRSGKDGSCTKAKCRPALEMVIGGWKTEGTRFTGLLTGVYRDGKFVYSGSVGTGFTAKTTDELLPKLGAARSDVSPYAAGAPRKTSDIHWVKPILVANVRSPSGPTAASFAKPATRDCVRIKTLATWCSKRSNNSSRPQPDPKLRRCISPPAFLQEFERLQADNTLVLADRASEPARSKRWRR